jgi:hypothetical protein
VGVLVAQVPTDQLLGPQFLNKLVAYSVEIQFYSLPAWDGYKWCVLMFLSSLGTAISNSMSYHLTQRLILRVRSVLVLLIYRKALRIPSRNRSDGLINNLMSQTDRQAASRPTSHLSIAAPLRSL